MKFKKKNSPVTKKIWSLLRFLPTPVRKRLIRSQFEVNFNLSSDYVFKHAETVDEIQDALHIVYENYTHLGYIDKREEEMHFNTYLCIPTTTILIMKYKGEVIGTMSIVLDSPFGLPTETTWDLSSLRSKHKYLAEISSLSIKRTHKSTKGHIFLMLCKLMWEYCTKVLKVDCIVMAGTQEVEPFYTDILCFKTVTAKTGQEHKLVKGNKSTCCYLEVGTASSVYEKEYKKEKPPKNLYNFFMHFTSPLIFLPPEHVSLQGLHMKKNTALIQILEKFPNLKEMFSNVDKLKLANLDPLSLIEQVMGVKDQTDRVFPRISIRCIDALLYHSESTLESAVISEAKIFDVSSKGFGVKTNGPINAKSNDHFVLIFEHEGETLSIHAQLRWTKPFESGYMVLEKSQDEWKKFVTLAFEEINLPLDSKKETAIKKSA